MDGSVALQAVWEWQRKLGYPTIKPEQLEAVESLLKGEDVFLSVPTGFGKSLVFQMLPFCADSLLRSCTSRYKSPVVVVIAPLLSLMHDQVSKLVSKGVKAVCDSGENPSVIFTAAVEGGFTHLFGSPESFVGNKSYRALFSDAAFSEVVVALAIDEAHCIVKW